MKFNSEKIKSAVSVGLVSLSIVVSGLGPLAAQATIANLPIPQVGPGTVGGIVNLVRAIVQWLYIIFFILAVLFILWAAILYLTAAGDPEKVGKAKNLLIYAVVAIIVAFLAVAFETIIGTFLTSPQA